MPYLVSPFQLVFLQTMTTKSLINSELPFTIECMIENTLLHSILNTIVGQIKWPWQTPQDDNWFDPLCGLLEIKKWGTLQKEKMDNTNEWATWWWTNEKTIEQNPFIAKERPRPNLGLIKQDIKYYHWAMFKHAMEFLKQRTILKRPLPEHYFINFLNDLSNED